YIVSTASIAVYPVVPIAAYHGSVSPAYPTAVLLASGHPASVSPTTAYFVVASPVTVNRRLPR
ncbi:hypothetical protein A2U01_0051724, partial [Trifolium medium]|nr:hypothetical protein [Trifolium medium]